MKIYLAGEGHKPWIKHGFFDFYRLHSYVYLRADEVPLLSNYRGFMLDSGVFSYLNGRSSRGIDWDRYVYEYGNFVRKNGIEHYVEIDIDRIIGLTEVEKLRKKLESLVGYKSLPVWHIDRGYDKWIELCREYDYICFGAFLTDGLPVSKYPLVQKFIYDASRYGTKVHGLGFTHFEYMKLLKFYSVDSSSWSAGNRYGFVCKFDGEAVKIIKKAGHRVDSRPTTEHNFREWIKFSRYAEDFL